METASDVAAESQGLVKILSSLIVVARIIGSDYSLDCRSMTIELDLTE